VVAKLNVADHLANGPKPVAALACELRASEDALDRVLRALSVAGLFVETAPRQFALAPPGNLLRRDVQGSLHPIALWISSPFHFSVYANLLHSVLTGTPATEPVVQMPVFEYLAKDQELSGIFRSNAPDSRNRVRDVHEVRILCGQFRLGHGSCGERPFAHEESSKQAADQKNSGPGFAGFMGFAGFAQFVAERSAAP
jgi:hypothetical protein